MILSAHQYRDRIEAGQLLARQLAHYADRVDTLVLALRRGGVPIAAEIAAYLNAPLDLFMAGKLTLPDNPDFTLGAIAAGGVSVLDDDAIRRSGLGADQLNDLLHRETAELDARQQVSRESRPPPRIAGRVVIVVDEGISSGFSMHAAVIALHREQPAWLVVAAPVGNAGACEELAQEAHEVVCPLRPEPFQSVGLWYDHFSPIDDEEVRLVLRRASGLPRG